MECLEDIFYPRTFEKNGNMMTRRVENSEFKFNGNIHTIYYQNGAQNSFLIAQMELLENGLNDLPW